MIKRVRETNRLITADIDDHTADLTPILVLHGSYIL